MHKIHRRLWIYRNLIEPIYVESFRCWWIFPVTEGFSLKTTFCSSYGLSEPLQSGMNVKSPKSFDRKSNLKSTDWNDNISLHYSNHFVISMNKPTKECWTGIGDVNHLFDGLSNAHETKVYFLWAQTKLRALILYYTEIQNHETFHLKIVEVPQTPQ